MKKLLLFIALSIFSVSNITAGEPCADATPVEAALSHESWERGIPERCKREIPELRERATEIILAEARLAEGDITDEHRERAATLLREYLPELWGMGGLRPAAIIAMAYAELCGHDVTLEEWQAINVHPTQGKWESEDKLLCIEIKPMDMSIEQTVCLEFKERYIDTSADCTVRQVQFLADYTARQVQFSADCTARQVQAIIMDKMRMSEYKTWKLLYDNIEAISDAVWQRRQEQIEHADSLRAVQHRALVNYLLEGAPE